MKHFDISLTDLKPNPHRDLKKYPLNQTKIAELAKSIKQNGFWGGLVCRKNGDRYQLAFGHHRLAAIKKCGIDVAGGTAVLPLSDVEMIRHMHAENQETWGVQPAGIIETVEMTKRFLDGVLAKYDTLADLKMGQKVLSHLFKNQKAFANAKRKDTGGVGEDTLMKFLGDYKTITVGYLRSALTYLNEENKAFRRWMLKR